MHAGMIELLESSVKFDQTLPGVFGVVWVVSFPEVSWRKPSWRIANTARRGPQPTLEPRNDQPIPVGLVAPPVMVEPFLPSWCVGEEEKAETEAIDDVQVVEDEEDEAQDDGMMNLKISKRRKKK